MLRRGAPATCQPRRQHQGQDRSSNAQRGPDQLILRPYEPSDLDGLLTCWEAAIRSTDPQLREDFICSERGNIAARYLPKVQTIVAEAEGIAGFISLLGREVAALFVHPKAQRQGVGSTLLGQFGAPLTLEVFEANLSARAFYHRKGFRQVGTRLHEEAALPLLGLALDECP